MGFSKNINLKFNLLWNYCPNFSFLGVLQNFQDWEAHRDNHQPSICWFFYVKRLWVNYYYTLRKKAPRLIDFAWFSQKWTLTIYSIQCIYACRILGLQWTLIDTFQGNNESESVLISSTLIKWFSWTNWRPEEPKMKMKAGAYVSADSIA